MEEVVFCFVFCFLLSFIVFLLSAKHCAKNIIYDYLNNHYMIITTPQKLLFTFYKWGNEDSERLNNCPKGIPLLNFIDRILSQACWFQEFLTTFSAFLTIGMDSYSEIDEKNRCHIEVLLRSLGTSYWRCSSWNILSHVISMLTFCLTRGTVQSCSLLQAYTVFEIASCFPSKFYILLCNAFLLVLLL